MKMALKKPHADPKKCVYGKELTKEQQEWLDDYKKEGAGMPFMTWMQHDLEEAMPMAGRAIYGQPKEMAVILDYTVLRGGGSGVYLSFIYQLPKWDYTVRKVDEYLDVNPTWAEFYNITIEQKHKLENAIKQGLVSATQAVTDYELIRHDLRRYQEMLDYFVKAKKGADEHVLRSVFVDRVDAYTGEGFSMISMAKRWPTIITDFIRMNEAKFKDEKRDITKVDDIAKMLDVSKAEATILKTKHQLFTEWKELFLPTLKERVARLKVLVDARRKSIEEYRNWIKPLVAQMKTYREKAETDVARFVSDAYLTPGFGQSQAFTGVRLWVWKSFSKPEKGKPSEFWEEHGGKKSKHGFIVDPLDDLVRFFAGIIAKNYGVTITEEEIEGILANATKVDARKLEPHPLMKPDVPYYTLFDINVFLSLTKTPPPEGMETDNLMFYPIITHVVSQNILLLFLIEIHCRERAIERYVQELIGTKEAEEEHAAEIEKEFAEPKKERKLNLEPLGRAKDYLELLGERVFYFFVKPGPYESNIYERYTKMYSRASGPMYSQVIDFLKAKMQVK